MTWIISVIITVLIILVITTRLGDYILPVFLFILVVCFIHCILVDLM